MFIMSFLIAMPANSHVVYRSSIMIFDLNLLKVRKRLNNRKRLSVSLALSLSLSIPRSLSFYVCLCMCECVFRKESPEDVQQ